MIFKKSAVSLIVIGFVTCAQQASGDFQILKITYEEIPSNFGSTVVVYSNAIWHGRPSPEWDHSWFTTFLNDSSRKADLKDPEAAFKGVNVFHFGWEKLTNGFTLNCDDRDCAASGYVPNCDNAKADVFYLGHAKVGVNTLSSNDDEYQVRE